MNQLVRTTLNLEQYQCRRCRRLFYVNEMDRSYLDIDFGCPYGCDDNGEHIRTLSTGVKEVQDVTARKPKQDGTIRDRKVVIHFCAEEFEMSIGRKPKNQEEFDEWARLAEKGLLNGHIDWDILYDCTCDEFNQRSRGDA